MVRVCFVLASWKHEPNTKGVRGGYEEGTKRTWRLRRAKALDFDVGKFRGAMTIFTVFHRAVVAAAGTATLATQGAHQPPRGEEPRRRNNEYHKNRLPHKCYCLISLPPYLLTSLSPYLLISLSPLSLSPKSASFLSGRRGWRQSRPALWCRPP